MTTVASASSSSLTTSHLAGLTPHSQYLDLKFPLPEKRYVGCLACQRDPLLSSLVATVLRSDKVVRKSLPPAAGKGKKGKPPVEAAARPEEELWEIELNDTCLFPEGGGQNSDTGTFVPLDSNGTRLEHESAVVRDVFRRNLDAVHLTTRPFPVGSKVVARVDMDRRIDLMSQHTAQHLVSAVFERDHNLETVSWSLQKYPEPCYVELERTPTPEEIERVQDRCNQVIQERRSVSVRMELVTEETGVELNEKAPQDYRDDQGGERPPVQRTVIIEGLDENPCCGTHYPDLSYLRSIFISPFTTSIRGTNCRLYFAAGPRVVAMLSTSHQIARNSALEAGCNPLDLADRVGAMVSSLAELKRRDKRLKEELASHVADRLWRDALVTTSSERAPEPNRRDRDDVLTGLSFREEEATNSLDFLQLVSIELSQRYNSLVERERERERGAEGEGEGEPSSRRKYLFLLAVGDTAGSTTPTNGAVLILGSDDLVVKAGKLTVEKLAGKIKGGGKGRWQGKLTDKWAPGDREKLERVLEESV